MINSFVSKNGSNDKRLPNNWILNCLGYILWSSPPPPFTKVKHNPRSGVKLINFDRSTEAGENFQLLVFVNDVDQAVTEGNDGVEHM